MLAGPLVSRRSYTRNKIITEFSVIIGDEIITRIHFIETVKHDTEPRETLEPSFPCDVFTYMQTAPFFPSDQSPRSDGSRKRKVKVREKRDS